MVWGEGLKVVQVAGGSGQGSTAHDDIRFTKKRLKALIVQGLCLVWVLCTEDFLDRADQAFPDFSLVRG